MKGFKSFIERIRCITFRRAEVKKNHSHCQSSKSAGDTFELNEKKFYPDKCSNSDLGIDLITKYPITMSQLEKAISAAGVVKYKTIEKEQISNAKNTYESITNEVNVKVHAGLIPPSEGTLLMCDLCTNSFHHI